MDNISALEQRMLLKMQLTCFEIYKARGLLDDPTYRGLEYPWYAVWNHALVKLSQGTSTLLVTPQARVAHEVKDNDGKTKDTDLIPDFVLTKIVKNRALGDAQPPALERTAAIIEIKRLPANERNGRGIMTALCTAVNQLKQQIQAHFEKDEEVADDLKRVVGILIAGPYWSWKVYDKDSVAKTLSDNEDPTYRPPGETSSGYRGPREGQYYKLGTQASNEEMDKLKKSMKNLPGVLQTKI